MAKIWYDSGHDTWKALLGPITMMIERRDDTWRVTGAFRGKSASWIETYPSLQDAKDACEMKAAEWLRAERDVLEYTLRLLGKD